MQKSASATNSSSILAVGFTAVAALVATFALANAELALTTKTRGFSAIVAAFLMVAAFLYFRQLRRAAPEGEVHRDDEQRAEQGLAALDEANEILGGSLTRSDVFKLLIDRVRQMTPFAAAELLLLDKDRQRLLVVDSCGVDRQAGSVVDVNDERMKAVFSTGSVNMQGIDVAIPLKNGSDVFGVLNLTFDGTVKREYAPSIFEAIGNRIAPLIVKSLAMERSRSNALTDATTDLPNERAFHLILENQVAESQRKHDERPLTILALDIKNFSHFNKRFGHPAGDQILNFAAHTIRDSLRQMDFFARSKDDEFLVVLPTATKEMSHEIVTRIHTGFFGRKLKVNDTDAVEIELNVGWAAFGPDGDTPSQLLAAARVRKAEAKAAGNSRVVFFPHGSGN